MRASTTSSTASRSLVAYASRVVEAARRRPAPDRLARRERGAPRGSLVDDRATSWRAEITGLGTQRNRCVAAMSRVDAHAHVAPAGLHRPRAGARRQPAQAPGRHRRGSCWAMMERYEIDAAVISTRPARRVLRRPGPGRETRAPGERGIADGSTRRPATASPASRCCRCPMSMPRSRRSRRARPARARRRDAAHPSGGHLPRRPGMGAGPGRARPTRRLIFVHPTLPPTRAARHHHRWLYEFPFETPARSRSSSTPATLERYPGIRFQFAHLGGAAPFLAAPARLARRPRAGSGRGRRRPARSSTCARQYYDTGLSNNAPRRGDARVAGSTTSSSAPTGRISLCPRSPAIQLPGLACSRR